MCDHSDSVTLGLSPFRECVLSQSTFSDSRLLYQELFHAGPGLHTLPRSKPLRFRFLGAPQRHRRGWACVLHLAQVQEAQVTRCLASVVTPSWRLQLIPFPIPSARFCRCTTDASSQVWQVSLLGSWSLAVTLPVHVKHSESQEVLASNEVYLQFVIGSLPGALIAPFSLWLPSPAYLQWRMGQSTAC